MLTWRCSTAVVAAITAIVGASSMQPSLAQEAEKYPARTVTIVVPMGAGAGLDLTTRFIAKRLETRMGQPFIIENKAGMAGGVGSASVARSAPDGYTLLTSFLSANVFNPIIHKKMPYSLSDLSFVTLLYDTPFVLVVPTASGIESNQQLVAKLKADQAGHSYASGGIGSAAHIAASMYLRLVGTPGVLHVPYRTTVAVFPDLISNRVAFGIFSPDSVISYIKAGQLRALFVAADKRLASLPDVPTSAEIGLPEMRASSWYVMQAPAQTPRPIRERLAREVSQILQEPESAAWFVKAESTPLIGYTPDSTAAFVEKERARWEPHVRASGASVE
jgi:tripartite-type tricarboxylate transporter receptor subunit TctC